MFNRESVGRWVLVFLLVFFTAPVSAQAPIIEERITITTYYPAPYGMYRELRSRRMAIGDKYIDDAASWQWEEAINEGADLVVEGSVGIGYDRPGVSPIEGTEHKGIKLVLAGNNEGSEGRHVGMYIYNTGDSGETGMGILATEGGSPYVAGSIYKEEGVDSLVLRSRFYGASPIKFIIDDEEKVRISDEGKVGIGTPDPQTNLHISGEGEVGSIIDSIDGGNSVVALYRSGTYIGSILAAADDTGGLVVKTNGSDYLRLQTTSLDRLWITPDGDVGVGPKSPRGKLGVDGAINYVPQSSPPAGSEGSLYYDDGENKFKYHDGTSWKDFGGEIGNIVFSSEITGNECKTETFDLGSTIDKKFCAVADQYIYRHGCNKGRLRCRVYIASGHWYLEAQGASHNCYDPCGSSYIKCQAVCIE